MKALGCLVGAVGCVVFGAAVGLLALLWLHPPEGWTQDPHLTRPSPAPSAVPDQPPRRARRPKSLGRFERSESFDRYLVRYGFVDYEGRIQDVTCSISRSQHERAVAAYGYRPAEIDAYADSGLRTWLDAEADRRGVRAYVRLKISAGGVNAEPHDLPQEMDERAHVVGKLAEFYTVWGQIPSRWQALRDEAYVRHGILRRGHTLLVDHGSMVLRSEEALGDCARALAEASRGYDLRQETGVVVAFFQEIPYEVPPDEVDGRQTLGLWVPTEVLVGDHGDCDSKSLAFGAIWRRLGQPVLVVDLPHHVLVGVEMRPGPDDKFVRLGNRYFVLCEVAGSAKLRPGREGSTPVQGYFDYTLVEPEGHGEPLQRGGSSS